MGGRGVVLCFNRPFVFQCKFENGGSRSAHPWRSFPGGEFLGFTRTVMVQAPLRRSHLATAFPYRPPQNYFSPPHVFCNILRITLFKCKTCRFLFCRLPCWTLRCWLICRLRGFP